MKVFRYIIKTYIDDKTRDYINEPCRGCNFEKPGALIDHLRQKAENGSDAHRVIDLFLTQLYVSIHGDNVSHLALYNASTSKKWKQKALHQ